MNNLDDAADAYAAEYVMTTEGNDYIPTEWERELIVDALHGFLATTPGGDLLEQAAIETEVAWEVWEDDLMVASSSSEADGLHYLAVYSQDGPMRFVKATTTRETL